jgi:hypothetical protein
MNEVKDAEGNHVGYSYRCSWCHDCGPVKPTKEEAVDAYLEHQGSEECVISEARYEYYFNSL